MRRDKKIECCAHVTVDGLPWSGQLRLTEEDVEMGSSMNLSSSPASIKQVARLAEIGLLVVKYVERFRAEGPPEDAEAVTVEIKVTPAMVEAGFSVLASLAPVTFRRFLGDSPESTVRDIYRAMEEARDNP